jgi:hypothetical protein
MREKTVADPSDDLEAYADAAAATVELPIDPAHRPGVVLNLGRIAEMAKLVMSFPLPDDVDIAPIFHP